MSIDVKANKQSKPNEEPRKRFEFFSRERMTALPVHIGLVIIAFAVYFRHLLTPQGPVPSSQQDRGEGRPDEKAPSAGTSSTATRERQSEETGRESKSMALDLGQYESESDIDWSPAILVSDPAPSLHFTRPLSNLQPVNLFPGAIGVELSNDNLPRSSTPALIPHAPQPASGGDQDSGDSSPQEPGNSDGGDDVENDDDDGGRPNRGPVVSGPVRLNDIIAGQTALIGLAYLLAGSHDPDGDKLSVTNVTAVGADLGLSVTSEGLVAQSESGMLGAVSLAYQVSDGHAEVWQTAHFNIVRNVAVLTPGDDLFLGTAYDDDIDARAGDDIVNGLAGNDLIMGRQGEDHLFGDAGNDVLHGGEGSDVIFGGSDNDIIHGGKGHDRMFGETGHDTLFGEAGDDWIEGGDGDDILDGGTSDDTLLGGSGDDVIIGAEGDDDLSGDAGDDTLDGGSGRDVLSGGDGNDVLSGGAGDDIAEGGAGGDVVLGGGGNDVYDGGGGFDILSYAGTADDLIIDDRNGQVSGAQTGEDSFTGFEQVSGGEGDDLFVIGASARVISGGRGRDLFVFEVMDDDPTLSEDVVHDILDFVVGDRIRVRDYDISREARAAERDLFRSIYGDDDDDWLRADIPILVTHASHDGIDQTIIRADFNSDDLFDVTINIRDVLLAWTNDPVLV